MAITASIQITKGGTHHDRQAGVAVSGWRVAPDGRSGRYYGHESIVTNPAQPSEVVITLYWTNREPTVSQPFTVDARRVCCIHITERDGLFGQPVQVGEQYAIGLTCSAPVVAQYGRLDMRTGSMAFYTTPGYAE